MLSGSTLGLNLSCTVSLDLNLSTKQGRKIKSFSYMVRREHSAFGRKLTLVLSPFLCLPLGIFVLKILSPHDICQGTIKSLLADIHRSWG